MTTTRRRFLTRTMVGLAGAAALRHARASGSPPDASTALDPTAPPAFGTSPSTGPAVSAATFAAAEKLVQVTMSPKERELAASNWRQSMAALYERRTGPRKVVLADADLPATIWNPVAAAGATLPTRHPFVRREGNVRPLL